MPSSSKGMVERFNRTLTDMIHSFVNNNRTNWDEHINLLLAAHRSTQHPATRFTPNYLMLGREINLPLQIVCPLPAQENRKPVNEYTYNFQQRLEEAYHTARQHLMATAERQKNDYDTRLTKHTYKTGDLVYKFDNTIHQKCKSPWTGSHLITKVLSAVTFEIRHRSRTEIIHYDRLKPYIGPVPDCVAESHQ
jgi:hypothetical protein